jgi:hypothetical protein
MKIGIAFEAVAPAKDIDDITISFLPTGKIDHSAPLSTANRITLETTFDPTFDNLTITYEEYWEPMGRMFYIFYWLCLIDLGQNTTVNQKAVSSNLYPNGPQVMLPNLFVDETLYNNYTAYFPKVAQIFNRLKINASTYFNHDETDFTPLNLSDIFILQNYSCEQRKLKSGLTLFVAVVAADYVFVGGGYSLVVFIASRFQKRRMDGELRYSFAATEMR